MFRHYNNRYNYSNDHYQAQPHSKNKTSKRGRTLTINNRQQKPAIINGSNNNNNNIRHHSVSDNDQKEGEEWETASESSTNMRNGHYDNNSTANETKTIHRGRTPPKKSFSNQRYIEKIFFRLFSNLISNLGPMRVRFSNIRMHKQDAHILNCSFN